MYYLNGGLNEGVGFLFSMGRRYVDRFWELNLCKMVILELSTGNSYQTLETDI
jgi:hypothetical protein